MKRAIAISNENFIVTNGTDEDLAQYFAIGNETMIISDDFDKLSQKRYLSDYVCWQERRI